MLLRDLVAADVTLPEPGPGRSTSKASPPTAGPSRPASCSPRCRARRPTARASSPTRWRRGAVAVLAEARCQASRRPARRRARSAPSDPRRALALLAARFYPLPAGAPGRGHRHQRQDLGRRIHPRRSSRPAGHEAASIGTLGIVSRRWSTYGSLTTPDPVALHEALDRLAARGRDPCGARGVEPRPRPAPARRHPHRRRRGSPISAATTWTTTRPSKTISPPSCGCSRSSCRRTGSRWSTWTARAATAVEAAATAARRQRLVRASAGTASRSGIAGHHADRLRQRLEDRGLRPAARRRAAARRRLPGVECAGRRRPRHRRRRRRPRPPSTALGRLRRRARPAGAGRPEGEWRTRSSSTTPTSPRRSCGMLQALRPMTVGRLVVVVRRRRRPRSRQAAADGQGGGRERRHRHRHRRQSAQREAGGDPRGDPRRRTGARSRSATGARRSAGAIAMLASGDVLCIAGKGHETGQIIGGRRAAVLRPSARSQAVLAAEEAA